MLFELTTGDEGFDEIFEARDFRDALRKVFTKHRIENLPEDWSIDEITQNGLGQHE